MKKTPTFIIAGLALTAIGATQVAPYLTPTGVTPGSYTSADITVNAFGQITVAANGMGGGGTNQWQIGVDGVLVNYPNLADSPELGVTATGTNVTYTLVVGSIATNKIDPTFYSWINSKGAGGGDVYTTSNNVFTGLNQFTNMLTIRGGIELTNYYLRITGPSAGGRIFPTAGEGMEILYDATNWVDSTGSSGRGEIQIYDRSGASYGDFRFNARNSGFYGAGTLVLLITNGQARVTGNLFANGTNVMSAVNDKQPLDSDLTALSTDGSIGSGAFVRSNTPTIYNGNFTGTNSFSTLQADTLSLGTLVVTNALSNLTFSNPYLSNGIAYEQHTLTAHSSITNFVVDPTLAQYQYILCSAQTSLRFLHATNVAPGRQTVMLVNAGTNASVAITLAANQFANTTNTVTITTGQILPISFYCYGANNTNVLASVPTIPFIHR